jgi:uncharacterized protein YjbJ (UPF0337 family)
VKGQIKQVAGTVSGDKDLESEGNADRRAGQAKVKLGHAEEKIEGLIDKVKDARPSK